MGALISIDLSVLSMIRPQCSISTIELSPSFPDWLFLTDVLGPEVFQKVLKIVGIAVASGFHAQQDAAALYARVVNSCSMLRDARADERANYSSCRCSSARSSESGRDGPGYNEA